MRGVAFDKATRLRLVIQCDRGMLGPDLTHTERSDSEFPTVAVNWHLSGRCCAYVDRVNPQSVRSEVHRAEPIHSGHAKVANV